MDKIVFLVEGSEPDPYEVTFTKQGENLTALCTCKAGENRLPCKHIFRILDGDPKNVVSDNVEKVAEMPSWLERTDVESVMQEVKEAEAIVEDAKKELKKRKKNLARVFHD